MCAFGNAFFFGAPWFHRMRHLRWKSRHRLFQASWLQCICKQDIFGSARDNTGVNNLNRKTILKNLRADIVVYTADTDPDLLSSTPYGSTVLLQIRSTFYAGDSKVASHHHAHLVRGNASAAIVVVPPENLSQTAIKAKGSCSWIFIRHHGETTNVISPVYTYRAQEIDYKKCGHRVMILLERRLRPGAEVGNLCGRVGLRIAGTRQREPGARAREGLGNTS